MSASKHDWHTMDAELGIDVRQATNRLRRNRWEISNRRGQVIEMRDDEFDRLRIDPKSVLSKYPGFLP